MTLRIGAKMYMLAVFLFFLILFKGTSGAILIWCTVLMMFRNEEMEYISEDARQARPSVQT